MVEYTVTVTSNTAYNGSSNSTTYTATVGSLSLAQGSILDLGDVVVTSLADGEVLAYDSASGNFVNVSNAGGGGGVSDGDKGDITVSASGATWTIDADAVTYSKIQDVSQTNVVLGRDSAGAGIIEEITPANLRTMINVEDGADVTDTANVTAAGALMDSEVTNLAAVKAFDPTDYATAAQGALADSATQPGDNISTLTNDAGFITATLTTEQVQDIAGGMFSGNTETLITATYQDVDGTIDLVVDNDLSNYDNSSSGFITGITSEPLGDLSDVTITTLGSDELLFTQDGSTWINQTLAEAGISAVGHSHATSDITSGTFADARISESSVTQHEAALTITESQISDLDHDALKLRGIGLDTTVGSPSDGDILVYRSAGTDWVLETKPAGGSNPAINDVTDVTITSVADNEVLAYDSGSGDWINQTAAEAGLAAASHSHATSDITSGTFADARIAQSNVTQHESALTITESQISDLGTYLTDITGEAIGSLSDVTITTVADNEVMAYNAATSTWINQTAAEAGLATSAQGALADSATQPGDNISTLTNDSGFITATLTQEQVEDYVGGMLTGTETLITVTYQDATGNIDFVVNDDLSLYDNTTSGFISSITSEPLSDLSDVTITTIASGEILKWNGSAWINNTLAEAGIAAASHSHTASDITDLASATVTFTNKTFDANGTGNSISNLEVADFTAASIVTSTDTIAANNNDTTIPTSAAVKAYADSVGGGGVDTSGTPVANDFARFTDADTIEGRSYSEVRSDLGLVIGTNVQAWDAFLDDIGALTDPGADRLLFWDDSVGDITWLTAGTGLTISGTTITPRAASTSQTGIVELAIASEVDTGTSTTLAVTPDALAGSNLGEKSFCIAVYDSSTDVATGDGTIGFCVPASMAGMNIVEAHASVHTAGTTGTTDVQIRRRRDTTDADVLSTKLTIDSGETRSTTAASSYAVNGTNDDLAAGDMIYVDVDAVSTTAPKGLSVTITARLP